MPVFWNKSQFWLKNQQILPINAQKKFKTKRLSKTQKDSNWKLSEQITKIEKLSKDAIGDDMNTCVQGNNLKFHIMISKPKTMKNAAYAKVNLMC